MNWNVPNTLTIFRLLSAPGLALVFLFLPHPWADWVALIVFIGASVSDWIDGHLARSWGQESKFGAMLDPIADKAMVVIALMVLCALSGVSFWVLLPAAVIVFREVFVSGLREYLGAESGKLKVTKLAKWKTTIQMIAISVLFANGIFEYWVAAGVFGLGPDLAAEVLSGQIGDEIGLAWAHFGMLWSWNIGILLLWAAAALTLATGWQYFSKALPYLKDET